MTQTKNCNPKKFIKRRNNNEDKNKKTVVCKPSSFNCYNCGIKGHYADQCREKEKTRDQTQASVSALSLFNVNLLTENAWCIYSGASSHLCRDRHMFVSFKAHNEGIKHMHGRQQQCKSRRYWKSVHKTATTNIVLNDVLFVSKLQFYAILCLSAEQSQIITLWSLHLKAELVFTFC